MQVMKAMPEFINRRDIEPRAWEVQEGNPVRGDAWTEMRAAKMRVPYGADDTSRVVRAHELMHAKVSPTNPEAMLALGIETELLMMAEEFRVNMLVAKQGFPIDALADGSESQTGKIIGENGDWNGVVRFLPAVAGTKAGANFLRGLKTTNPEFEKQARELQKALAKIWKKTPAVASTVADENGLPQGFNKLTVPIARLLESLLKPEGNDGTPDEFGNEEIPDVKNIVKSGAGAFARLIELQLPKPRAVDGNLGRKRVATNIGRNPRRIGRMLTDPERRIFDRRAKGRGGVVLIDQSGSMRLETENLWEIIEEAPGCVIIGYSHRVGSEEIPNVWVMAERGKVVEKVPAGNGGNGVDGPAIRFAQAKRKQGEPFIWVCDGYVTDGKADNNYANLTDECAGLVVKHGIHQVGDVEDAIKALKQVKQGKRLKANAVGEIKNSSFWKERNLDD